ERRDDRELALPLEDVRERGAEAVDGPEVVHVHDLLEALELRLLEELDHGDPGVRDEDVEPARLLEREADERLVRLGLRHVARVAVRLAALRADGLADPVELRSTPRR